MAWSSRSKPLLFSVAPRGYFLGTSDPPQPTRSCFMRIASALLVALLPMGLAIAQQPAATTTKHAFTPADWYKVSQVAGPVLSPDGKQIAFTVTTVREAENKRHTEIWMVPVAGGTPVRMTSPSTESTNPRFSDDGKILYFTSQRPGIRGANWALRLDQPGEAFQPERPPQFQQGVQPADKSFTIIAEGEGGGGFGGRGGRGGGRGGEPSSDSTTSPDSALANDPFGRMLPMARPPYGAVTKPENPARFDGRHVVEMVYKSNNAGFVPGPTTAPRVVTP